MNRNEYILDLWKKSIDGYKKLKLREAKLIYNEIINSSGNKCELLREELITGTLYLLPNIIKNSLLPYIKSNVYDMDDIINACNETLISLIDKGRLLEISYYSEMFTGTFFYSVIDKLNVNNYDIFKDIRININVFSNILSWYGNECFKGNIIDYDMFIKYLDDNYKEYFKNKKNNLFYFYNSIVSICNNLERNGLVKENIAGNNFDYLRELFMQNVWEMYNVSCNGIIIEDNNNALVSDIVGKEMCYNIFNNCSLTDGQKKVLYYKYGFYDGVCKSNTEISSIMGISITRVGQLEKSAFEKLNGMKSLIMEYLEDTPKKYIKK